MTALETMTPAELLARARAAERTVEVLKRKVHDLYNGEGSIIQHGAERAKAREVEMRRRQEIAALRNVELARYSATLEREVAERTRDLQTILDNVVFGFLVVDRDGTIREGATRSSASLLGRADLTGAVFAEAFGLSATRCAEFKLQLDLLFEDVLPEELVFDQLPRRSTNPAGRSLALDGRAIRDLEGAIEGALFTITDVTALEMAERETAHYRVLVGILRQREAFDAFVVDFHALIEQAQTAALAGDQSTVRRVVHTLKGNAACFGLSTVADTAHHLEDRPEIDAAAVATLGAALAQFLEDNADVLGMSKGPATLPVSGDELAALEKAATSGPAAVHAWIGRIRRQPARLMLGPLEALVPRLAKRFGKDVDLVVEGADLRVDLDLLRPVVRELGHLVRNAIDHGIEAMGARAGKPPTGHINIRLADDGKSYRIEVADDGRGIDVDRLVAQACRAGRCREADLEGKSRDELLRLVFLEGVSTAETTTDVSGRGIGMSAILAAVEGAGGTIRIHSSLGQGTSVEITVPTRPSGITRHVSHGSKLLVEAYTAATAEAAARIGG